ncbi:hypothetical protein V5799_007062 [Amblyomma americanum]|uniref:Reverse transcriptase domain-containing protein n=1 Tax=Amblyomma americanum TaxID=6943 RepID=A0AAQ4DUL7_AMBAM
MASERNVPRPRIRQWNCRSLRRRHAELVQLLPRIDCDVFALQETHVRAEEIKIPGYIGYSGPTSCAASSCSAVPCYDAAHRTGAPRTAIYVRTSLPHVVVSVGDLVSDAVECCAVIVRVRNTDTAVASVYVRPGVSWNAAFVEKLSDRLGKDAVICGDFNAHNTHWGCQGIARLCRADLAAHELERALESRRDSRSAPGADGITYKMLLNIDRGQRPALLAAYNEIWRSGDIPAEWRSAIVVPIHKKGKPQGVTSSYRPVSLTSSAGKILEAVALHRLEWIAAVREALSPEQSGFRAGRCTADCIAQVMSILEQAKAERQEAYLVLLDVRSAFDMLPHEVIMDALRWLGVSARLLRYVEAFLTGRTFQVRVGSTCSTE